MTTHRYLDTSALMRLAESKANPATRRNQLIAVVMEEMLAERDVVFGCSEITLLEYHTNITTNWRNQQTTEFSDQWWEDARNILWGLLESGKLTVLDLPARSTESVMALISAATAFNMRKVRAWDALHAVTAGSWALSLHAPVELVTSDDDFDAVLELTSFSGLLSIINLDVSAQTGEGQDGKGS